VKKAAHAGFAESGGVTTEAVAAGPGSIARSSLPGFMVWLGVVIAVAILTALGVWQLERRAWKVALIARVEERVHAPPIALPGPAAWSSETAAREEYTHVRASGRFSSDRDTYVQAVTDLGAGFWVLTPFLTDEGFTVLVNRGFVPPGRRDPATRPGIDATGSTTLTGLVRTTEPKGGFLRSNDPAHDRWYSRDVAAIAAARGLSNVAPYFIDAEGISSADTWPRPGLTVLTFQNNHLIYAATWFGLALLLCGKVSFAWRDQWRRRRVI
jgi:surfeit locus 1 family protein